MSSKYWVILVGALTLFVASCSDDDNPVTPPPNDDTVAPSTITDLTAGQPTGTTITLTWTAPGDDGDIAEADHYDIRYATFSITDDNWESATAVGSPPEPTVGGAQQSFTVGGLNSNTIYYFAIRAADEVPNWSGTSNVASARTHLAGNWTVYTTLNSELPSDTINDIAIELYTERYLATALGLAHLDGTDWSVYDTSGSDIISNDLMTVAIDGSGIKWIGSRNAGVSSFDGAVFDSLTSTNSGLTSNAIRGIAVDAVDDVWFGTVGGGLCQFDGNIWTDYRTGNSDIHSNIINAISFDDDGNLWIGFDLGGIDKFDGVNFEHYDASGALSASQVTSIAAGQTTMWFGSEIGVFSLSGSSWVNYNSSNSGLAHDLVFCVAVEPSGIKWFGTLNGLCRFDGTNWTTYTTQNSSLPDNVVRSVQLDSFGNIWIGTEGGLAVFND
ncbi:MAG: fibronectin type III domain-containing protein [Candidatus Zixiibacteriota bacterium]|nr:MAG: fibronectin type III domain-containing protein [candidate division Zixibacteria bacterium]